MALAGDEKHFFLLVCLMTVLLQSTERRHPFTKTQKRHGAFPYQNLPQLLLSLVSLLQQLLQHVTESCALLHQNLLDTYPHRGRTIRHTDNTRSLGKY